MLEYRTLNKTSIETLHNKDFLIKLGFEHIVGQYEMLLKI